MPLSPGSVGQVVEKGQITRVSGFINAISAVRQLQRLIEAYTFHHDAAGITDL